MYVHLVAAPQKGRNKVHRRRAEARRACHGRLAAVLDASGRAEPEELAVHYEGAGEGATAGGWYERAGDRAAGAVAFDQAAESYRKAFDLLRPEGDDARGLRTKLADALANAGRGAEAGPQFAAAADAATGLDGLELRRNAMEQFFVSGRTEDGLRVAGQLFGRLGQRLPGGPRRAFAAMIWEVIRLRLRGTGFRERPAAEIPAEDRPFVPAAGTLVLRQRDGSRVPMGGAKLVLVPADGAGGTRAFPAARSGPNVVFRLTTGGRGPRGRICGHRRVKGPAEAQVRRGGAGGGGQRTGQAQRRVQRPGHVSPAGDGRRQPRVSH